MRKNIVFLVVFIIVVVINVLDVNGQVDKDIYNDISKEIDYIEIQNVLDENSQCKKIEFKSEVEKVVLSKNIDFKEFGINIVEEVGEKWESNKKDIIKIFSITVIIAIFLNFIKTMECEYVAQTSFMMAYMVLLIVVIDVFKEMYNIGFGTAGVIRKFLIAIIPTYSVATFIGNGINSATSFNQLSMIIIFIIESLFVKILFPMINMYMIISIINNMCNVNGMKKLTELIELVIKWGTKGAIIFVTSLNTVQKMLSVTKDETNRKLLLSGIENIPYVGNGIEVINDTVFQSAHLIKNAIGVVGIVSIIILCAIPIINIIIYIFFYNILVAIIEPISDERVVNCIKVIADGGKYILEVLVTTIGMFFITIALMSL